MPARHYRRVTSATMSVDLFVAGAAFQVTNSFATKAGCGHAARLLAMTALRRSSIGDAAPAVGRVGPAAQSSQPGQELTLSQSPRSEGKRTLLN